MALKRTGSRFAYAKQCRPLGRSYVAFAMPSVSESNGKSLKQPRIYVNAALAAGASMMAVQYTTLRASRERFTLQPHKRDKTVNDIERSGKGKNEYGKPRKGRRKVGEGRDGDCPEAETPWASEKFRRSAAGTVGRQLPNPYGVAAHISNRRYIEAPIANE